MLLLLVGLRFYRFNLSVAYKSYFFSRSDVEFLILLVIVGLISAAGYLVNDIIDVDVDKVNRPNKSLAYSKKTSWIIYTAMNVSAICLSILVVESVVTFVFLMAAIVFLYWYSILFQKQPLIGNIVVASLTAIIPFLYIEFDAIVEKPYYFIEVPYFLSVIGFFITLFREVVKDIEDLKGDRECGYKTLPVLIGENTTRNLLIVLMCSFILLPTLLVWSILPFSIDYFSFLFGLILTLFSNEFILFIVFLIYILSLYFVFKKQYSKASLFLKLTLFSGVLILFIL
ncbi:MAG: UbiA family prenyltransferase [Flavobacteriales bacterium]|jgi:4-hydroxybenzoate polyprenyltransferase|nr:UbiA family prenyltransferase [Flavobacteriales bacterium]